MPIKLAIDVVGGASETVLEASRLALGSRPDLHLILVGPGPAELSGLDPSRVSLVSAEGAIDAVGDPMVAVRAARRSGVRVVHRLVRDGEAAGCVSAAAPVIVESAALFSLGQIPGVTRPVLGVIESSPDHPYVSVAAGSAPDPDMLAQCLLQGAELSRAVHDMLSPRVGLLANSDFDEATLAAILDEETYVGHLSASAYLFARDLDVLVADLNLVKLIRNAGSGAVQIFAANLDELLESELDATKAELMHELIAEASAIMDLDDTERAVSSASGYAPLRDSQQCAFVLGVTGISVVARSSDRPQDFAAAILAAAQAVQGNLIPRITRRMAAHVSRRRGEMIGRP